jgi:hypothetical protein
MKSLLSIIDKLSHNEIGTFRVFLSSHCKNGKNKKLELFDHLVNQTPESLPPDANDVSRQSIYQVKKRLKEELYAFLITQEQVKVSNDRSFLEMECHKKLYCFKILFDKGIHDHAQQVLNDVLNMAFKDSLHSIYLEAVNLKNIYFPLAQTKVVRKIPVNHQIKKLKKNLGRNLYVNQYLSEAGNFLHDSDDSFRRRLMRRLADFDLAETEPVIVRLMEVNRLFCQKNFHLAGNTLLELLDTDVDLSGDANMLSLVYIELIKACICMNDLAEAQRWLPQAEPGLIKIDTFGHVLLELQFIIAMRAGDSVGLADLLGQSKRVRDICENPVLKVKWLFYDLLMRFQEREFKGVIKGANANSTLFVKDKGWLMNLKMLELLSIYQLKDSDWLYYKLESFRKIISGTEWRHQRISQIVNLLKIQVSGKGLSQADMHDKITRLEKEFPWHPLSNELVNYCTCLKALLTADGHPSMSPTPPLVRIQG